MLSAASSTWSQTSSRAPARRYMSSRSKGVTNVRFSRSTTSCVSRSPSCSSSLISRIRSDVPSSSCPRSSTSRREIATTFVLERDDDGRVVEAFTPDFHLPEQDLYVEITMMKQSLVTRKTRKIRKLRERYPHVRIKLFYKRDVERLAQRYHLELAS